MNLDLQKVKRMPIMFALMMGAFVATLNETLLGNALPVLMQEFQVGAISIIAVTVSLFLRKNKNASKLISPLLSSQLSTTKRWN